MSTQNDTIDTNNNSISCSDYETAPKAQDLCMYSHIIRDDTGYRQFLGTDLEEGIEKILEDRKGIPSTNGSVETNRSVQL